MPISVYIPEGFPPLRNFRIDLETTPEGVAVWWWNLATGEGIRVGTDDLTLPQAQAVADGVDRALRLADWLAD